MNHSHLVVVLLTLGSPEQLTGGYLYHRRMAELADAHGATVRFMSFPDHPFPLPALWSRRVLRASAGADVIAVDSIAAAFVAPALWGGEVPAPLVAVLHQPPGGIDHGPARRRLQAALDRSLYRTVRRFIVASQALAEELAAEGFSTTRIDVVPPGCDDPGPASTETPDLRLGRGAALLAVGNWMARKGMLELLDAFALLPPDAATLHLVGRQDVEPGYTRRIRARLTRGDLIDRVVVHGPVSRTQVGVLYRAADAFVLPSRVEPYGTVYAEAMAAGLPVVGWHAGNLPHLADDGREGAVLPPGDVAGLANALARLTTDQAWRAHLAAGARERALSFPTWAQSAAAFFASLTRAREDRRDLR